jgi:hypothetical protein
MCPEQSIERHYSLAKMRLIQSLGPFLSEMYPLQVWNNNPSFGTPGAYGVILEAINVHKRDRCEFLYILFASLRVQSR